MGSTQPRWCDASRKSDHAGGCAINESGSDTGAPCGPADARLAILFTCFTCVKSCIRHTFATAVTAVKTVIFSCDRQGATDVSCATCVTHRTRRTAAAAAKAAGAVSCGDQQDIAGTSLTSGSFGASAARSILHARCDTCRSCGVAASTIRGFRPIGTTLGIAVETRIVVDITHRPGHRDQPTCPFSGTK